MIEIRTTGGEVDEVFAADALVHVQDLGGAVMLVLSTGDDDGPRCHLTFHTIGPLDDAIAWMYGRGSTIPVVGDAVCRAADWLQERFFTHVLEFESHGCRRVDR